MRLIDAGWFDDAKPLANTPPRPLDARTTGCGESRLPQSSMLLPSAGSKPDQVSARASGVSFARNPNSGVLRVHPYSWYGRNSDAATDGNVVFEVVLPPTKTLPLASSTTEVPRSTTAPPRR